MSITGVARGLALASHPGPTVAVTSFTALLAASAGHTPARAVLVTAAVFTGQLSIGWSNDLVDAARDRAVARSDKPLVQGVLPDGALRAATVVALVACVALSLACGLASAAVHLLLGVASGWAYNLYFKRTALSPLPYAVAFAALPAVVTLALPAPAWPPAWVMATGALLGTGAHLLNTLPDLAADEATGVRGLPHRLGAEAVRLLAPAVLLAGSVVAGFGRGLDAVGGALLAICVALAVVAVRARGKVPFLAAIGIALANVVSLVLAQPR
ncbi:UbiA family prenyltransferase [Intrasporangium calvum]|uniref:UbiA family prenyltransferase n=1 Tax=Intrasporangium calvum TaxID=53358 RepID=A0ABT5GML7_9MICO|nr:UbiA family prenyltransferase [Intrasporangium calvum]MDC5699135.1 UbiA family prenyltransferase [Intrasporangium calvum]